MGCPSVTQLLLQRPALAPELRQHLDSCDLCRALVARLAQPSGPEVTPRSDAPVVLGRYQLGACLGHGAMGVVYQAHDPALGRRVAIKLLDDAPFSAAEAQLMARLTHPHIVQIHDVGSIDDTLYLVMELAPHGTLRTWLAAAPRTGAQILEALLQAGRGLAAAHAAGIIHRDFKPDNVLVFGSPEAPSFKVADLGLARETDSAAATGIPSGATLDQTAHLIGTPAYMAPEQWTGHRATPASDQYAFAVTAYEALCGQLPHQAATLTELATQVREQAVDLNQVHPRRLRRVLKRALAKPPGARWPSMEACLDALLPPPRFARPSVMLLPMLALLILAALGYRTLRHRPVTPVDACQTVADDLGREAQHALAATLPALETAGIGNVEERKRTLGNLVANWQALAMQRTTSVCRAHGGARALPVALAKKCYERQSHKLAAALLAMTPPTKRKLMWAVETFAEFAIPACGETPLQLEQWREDGVGTQHVERFFNTVIAQMLVGNTPRVTTGRALLQFAHQVGLRGPTARMLASLQDPAGAVDSALEHDIKREADLLLTSFTLRPDPFLELDVLTRFIEFDESIHTTLARAKELAILSGDLQARSNLDLLDAIAKLQQANTPEAIAQLLQTFRLHLQRRDLPPTSKLLISDILATLADYGELDDAWGRLHEALAFRAQLLGHDDPTNIPYIMQTARLAYERGDIATGERFEQRAETLMHYWEPNVAEWRVAHTQVALARRLARREWPGVVQAIRDLQAHTPAAEQPHYFQFYVGWAYAELGQARAATTALQAYLTEAPPNTRPTQRANKWLTELSTKPRQPAPTARR